MEGRKGKERKEALQRLSLSGQSSLPPGSIQSLPLERCWPKGKEGKGWGAGEIFSRVSAHKTLPAPAVRLPPSRHRQTNEYQRTWLVVRQRRKEAGWGDPLQGQQDLSDQA